MRKSIAILTGGDSAERGISLQSGEVVLRHLPTDRYDARLSDIQGASWRDMATGVQVDKNDFSVKTNGRVIRFDCAFAAIHGAPLENGILQGYLDLIGLPYTCCDGYVSALTMNKYHTKLRLAPYRIPTAPAILVTKDIPIDQEAVNALGHPLFVKPNSGGSSFGAAKVGSAEALPDALAEAWKYDREVLVEAFVPGREFSNAVLRLDGNLQALPVTEIVPGAEFFDYAAKYEGRSKEITPASISDELTRQCQERSRMLYELLGCSGVVRFDYILSGDTFFFLEANTIPGISPASIVPQQARAAGWELGEFFSLLIEETLKNAPAAK